jgi:hypothetical protein
MIAALSIQRGWESPRPGARQNQPSPAQMAGFYFQHETRGRRTNMADDLQLGLFAAVLIAFVVTGCLVMRAPKKTSNAGPVKH